MKCYKCKLEAPLEGWKPTTKLCNFGHCSEEQARECPNCGEVAGHTWLDAQKEWRQSEYYKP